VAARLSRPQRIPGSIFEGEQFLRRMAGRAMLSFVLTRSGWADEWKKLNISTTAIRTGRCSEKMLRDALSALEA